MLVQVSNKIYAKVHHYYNSRVRLANAFAEAGLSNPPKQEEVDKLDVSKIRTLTLALQEVEKDALLIGVVEDDLEYATIDEAIADAPNQVPDADELVIVQRNLEEFKKTQAGLAPNVDKRLVMPLILRAGGLVDTLDTKDGAMVASIDKFDLIHRELIV